MAIFAPDERLPSSATLHGHSLPGHAQPPLVQEPPHPQNTPSVCVLVSGIHRYFLASHVNVGYSSFLALHESREFFSVSKGSFGYLLQQLSISFAKVRFIDVQQSSFRLWSINLVSGNILIPFQLVESISALSLYQHPCLPHLLFTLRSLHWGSSAVARWRKSLSTTLLALPTSPQELPPSSLWCVWCQHDSDLDFSSSCEYRASTKPCRVSSLFRILD